MTQGFEYRFCGPLHPPEKLGGHPPVYQRSVEMGVIIEHEVPVKMRDGVRIDVDVFRPADEKSTVLFEAARSRPVESDQKPLQAVSMVGRGLGLHFCGW